MGLALYHIMGNASVEAYSTTWASVFGCFEVACRVDEVEAIDAGDGVDGRFVIKFKFTRDSGGSDDSDDEIDAHNRDGVGFFWGLAMAELGDGGIKLALYRLRSSIFAADPVTIEQIFPSIKKRELFLLLKTGGA